VAGTWEGRGQERGRGKGGEERRGEGERGRRGRGGCKEIIGMVGGVRSNGEVGRGRGEGGEGGDGSHSSSKGGQTRGRGLRGKTQGRRSYDGVQYIHLILQLKRYGTCTEHFHGTVYVQYSKYIFSNIQYRI
jgi:hypothetical protein